MSILCDGHRDFAARSEPGAVQAFNTPSTSFFFLKRKRCKDRSHQDGEKESI